MRRYVVFSACAAALGVLAPARASAQQSSVYNWEGFYAGAHLGRAFGGTTFQSAITPGTPASELPDPAIFPSQVSSYSDMNSSVGGIQAGYDLFLSRVLIGIEADASLIKALDSSSVSVASPVSGSVYTFRDDLKSYYITTLRPRIGTPIWRALVYGTGGAALSTLTATNHFTGTGAGLAKPVFENSSVTQAIIGWTAGGGVETRLSSRISLRLEYLYTSFGDVSSDGNKVYPLTPPAPERACGTGGVQRQCFSHKANLDSNTIRLGLNYHLDFASDPLQ
jgi:outer membrane immunogenic protein